jgi:hypothetical protein
MGETMKITFTDTFGVPEEYSPKPASRYIPDWYKEMSSYIGEAKKPDGKGITTATIKRCMPVFDAIAAGYIITLPADVYVSQKNGEPWYEWSNHNLIQFHTPEQAPKHPNRNGLPTYPKFMNPWGIKTSKGYSTLFVQPFHRESVFTILPGIVDTDKSTLELVFPMWVKKGFEGIVEKDTPMVQIIPFKRDNWDSTFDFYLDGEYQSIVEEKNFNSTIVGHYIKNHWSKKKFK